MKRDNAARLLFSIAVIDCLFALTSYFGTGPDYTGLLFLAANIPFAAGIALSVRSDA